jgi:hypothetical protein
MNRLSALGLALTGIASATAVLLAGQLAPAAPCVITVSSAEPTVSSPPNSTEPTTSPSRGLMATLLSDLLELGRTANTEPTSPSSSVAVSGAETGLVEQTATGECDGEVPAALVDLR